MPRTGERHALNASEFMCVCACVYVHVCMCVCERARVHAHICKVREHLDHQVLRMSILVWVLLLVNAVKAPLVL